MHNLHMDDQIFLLYCQRYDHAIDHICEMPARGTEQKEYFTKVAAPTAYHILLTYSAFRERSIKNIFIMS